MTLSYRRLSLTMPLRMLLQLKQRIRFVRAAGGIVHAPDGSMLLILRNGRWDLPKGKVEPGETLLQAALREVNEETGLKNLSPGNPHSQEKPAGPKPLKTYHIYNLYGGWHLKQTSWFSMQAQKQTLSPQTEEGITAAEWVSPNLWHQRLKHSYGTLRTLQRLTSPHS